MDCEELMEKQASLTVAASPDTKIYVYRNMIKALPWFTSVRKKITDPAYARWFMNFSAAVQVRFPLLFLEPAALYTALPAAAPAALPAAVPLLYLL